MKAEERAKAIIDAVDDATYRNMNDELEVPLMMAESLIAAAIRSAEDEALERAAAGIENEIGSVSPAWVPEFVRALKSKEP
jgi:hypothetical protein